MKTVNPIEIKELLQRIKNAKSEAAKVTEFRLLIEKLFGIDSSISIEETVTRDGIFIGRVDLSVGKVILEFKKTITKKVNKKNGLEEIKKYLSSDQYKDSEIAILTDGINYEVYDRNLNLME